MKEDSPLILIPHKYPFLFLDKIKEVVPGKSGRALKNITVTEDLLQAFPERQPYFPNSILKEALAQLAGLVALTPKEPAKDNSQPKEVVGVIINADISFYSEGCIPGDRIELNVYIEKKLGRLYRFKAYAKNIDSEELLAQGIISLSIEQEDRGNK